MVVFTPWCFTCALCYLGRRDGIHNYEERWQFLFTSGDSSSSSYSGISAASRDPVEPQQESLERSLDVDDDVELPQPVAFFQWRS